MKITVTDARQTIRVGEQLAPLLKPQDVLLLDGELGAGKTTFTKGVAQGLGIHRRVKSPTFTLVHEYHGGRLPLYHMDVYRLEDAAPGDLGIAEYFDGDGVSVVEWSQFIKDELPPTYLIVHFIKDERNDCLRSLQFEPHGKRAEELMNQLASRLNN
ncbi:MULTISPECIES: tRNA (adenosine(37)-N6)-threonylcarbamoyltransferase complex ATPase subunit type 1 TsaE [unclassified Ligilactobacillus]|uniref:tRNA (adenosine(37)-N6)-threonylcarbamoyltransferase complex ATPase subunit type 1 TsaE n=1 Tax=unclassified Ligilactobacillus TaxID=2767920 RepID=UPI00385509C1